MKTGRTLTVSSLRYTANVIKFSIRFACETKKILAERSSSSNGVLQSREWFGDMRGSIPLLLSQFHVLDEVIIFCCDCKNGPNRAHGSDISLEFIQKHLRLNI